MANRTTSALPSVLVPLALVSSCVISDVANAQAGGAAPAALQDMADVKALKIMQTPTFYINGKPLAEYSLAPLRAQFKQQFAAKYL